MSIIVHDRKLVYIHPPKTGGFSIKTFLMTHFPTSQLVGHMPSATLREKYPETNCYHFFATVRNPWDRWVSSYFYQKDGTADFKNDWGNKEISFEDFCVSNHEWYPDYEVRFGHLRDQCHFLLDSDGNQIVDELLWFEHLASDFSDICLRFDLPVLQLPHRNSTAHDVYWKYYTRELRDLIYEKFKQDVLYLQYRFGD